MAEQRCQELAFEENSGLCRTLWLPDHARCLVLSFEPRQPQKSQSKLTSCTRKASLRYQAPNIYFSTQFKDKFKNQMCLVATVPHVTPRGIRPLLPGALKGAIGKPSVEAPAGNNPQRAKNSAQNPEFSTKSCCFSPPSQALMPFPAPNVPALTLEVAHACARGTLRTTQRHAGQKEPEPRFVFREFVTSHDKILKMPLLKASFSAGFNMNILRARCSCLKNRH